MKKSIFILLFFVFACNKPLNKRDLVVQAACNHLKITNTQNIQFSNLDSVSDYNDGVLLKMALIQQQLLLKHDTLKNRKTYDSLSATPKTKYYVIQYLDKTKTDVASNWQMLVMDTTFKIKI